MFLERKKRRKERKKRNVLKVLLHVNAVKLQEEGNKELFLDIWYKYPK